MQHTALVRSFFTDGILADSRQVLFALSRPRAQPKWSAATFPQKVPRGAQTPKETLAPTFLHGTMSGKTEDHLNVRRLYWQRPVFNCPLFQAPIRSATGWDSVFQLSGFDQGSGGQSVFGSSVARSG